ncbi:TIGR04141 family sporadically distributed protein, partial [Enterococcus faecalis]|uniref:TIGR04141 family sporadically distributed protein n=2 Tax=Bacteria TaxID=2 RepID=UPI003CC63779
MFSFGVEMEICDLSSLIETLKSHYLKDDYKTEFLWVDNVRKIKEKSDIDRLDQLLLDAIKNRDPRLVITLPEIEKWDSIIGFSFTRAK